jgi:uncharacterized delta-60 repeat protein
MKIRSIQLCLYSSFLKLLSAAVLFIVGTAVVCGQTAVPDSFDPNANGTIRVVVVQPDGKILIGGDFTALSPNGGAAVTRNRIARLNPDGTLDTAFDPNVSASGVSRVFAIALQADGKVLIGGSFTSVSGQTRKKIARLDATTGIADSFNPNASIPDSEIAGDVNSLAVQADGKILVGGPFNNMGGQSRLGLARLDPVTALADSFNPGSSSGILSIVVQPDGKILVAGGFTASGGNYGGQPRNRIARLDPTTGLADSFNPDVNGVPFSIALQKDGKVLFGGPDFTSVGGQPRNRIARVNADGTLDAGFDPNATAASAGLGVNTIAVQADGRILAGGNFTTIGGQPRNRIARLNATNGAADSFDPNSSGSVISIALQGDGKILAGGTFTSLTPNGGSVVTRNRIARLVSDARLANISTRLRVETGDNALIGGFIITGTQSKKVIIRAIGPSLPLADRLENPTLELRDSSGALLDANDDWIDSPNKQAIIDSTIPPSNDLESAIVATLPANGSGYTAIVRGVNGSTGIGVVEAYDLDGSVDSKLANISTRGLVQTGNNVLIAGTIVLGQSAQKVIIRAIGPSLTIGGKLLDPTLQLVDANGVQVAFDDNWRTGGQEAEIIATTIPPTNDFESAIVATLPGNGASYTAVVRGANDTTGIAVVEVYALN